MRWPVFWLLSLWPIGANLGKRFNYASSDCAARILASNPDAKSVTSILNSQMDAYLRNLCSYNDKHMVVELCQDIRVDTVLLANYELFSSTFKDIEVAVSKKYPPGSESEWRVLGRWQARNVLGEQVFRVDAHHTKNGIFSRFLRLRLLTHYGQEYYCPLSVLRVFGKTMIDDFAEDEDAKSVKRKRALDASTVVVVADDHAAAPPAAAAAPAALEPALAVCAVDERNPLVLHDSCPRPAAGRADEPHALQLFTVPLAPVAHRPLVFPIPMKPVRKTVIYQLRCPFLTVLQHPVCSSQYRSVTMLQREYVDPGPGLADGLFGGDAGGRTGGRLRKKQENIFKSIHDRLDVLEKGRTRHSLLLQATIQRFEYQLERILAEVEFTQHSGPGSPSYRERLQEYLVEMLEERLERAEERTELGRDVLAQIRAALWLCLLLAAGNAACVAGCLYLGFRGRRARPCGPAAAPEPQRHMQSASSVDTLGSVSGEQAVPAQAGSLERMEQALMDASPLLLFDPETELVDGIYAGSPVTALKSPPPPGTNPV